nr:AMP-binding protein [Streptomyces mutabilis]
MAGAVLPFVGLGSGPVTAEDLLGCGPASVSLLERMAETFSGAATIAVFGQTEMSPVTCVLEAKDALRKIDSVGKLLPTVSARIVDENINDVAPGEVGEIVYRGPNTMMGYWNNPQATAEAFEGGWFHSGDLAGADDEGSLHVVDRKKDMIISGGENVYCAEVENALAGHPAVAEAAAARALGRDPGRRRGPGTHRRRRRWTT